jgi:BASS family bile acid:Na+ symporter
MEAGFPIQTVLPLVVAAMMLAVGMSLRVADITALGRARTAAAIGLANMYLVFPALAFAIAASFPLSPVLQVGLVLLAASPSASTSTLFTYLARGDTALALALTSISKILPVLIIPIYVGLAAAWFTDTETAVRLSFADTSERLLQIVLLPVVAGMILRWRFPAATEKARPWVTRLSVLALIGLIFALVYRERHTLPDMLLSAGPAALALCLIGMACAYASSSAARLPATQRSALTIEVGMQSGGTAIAIAAGVMASPAMAVPAAVYSLIMYVAAGLFVWWQRSAGTDTRPAVAARDDR